MVPSCTVSTSKDKNIKRINSLLSERQQQQQRQSGLGMERCITTKEESKMSPHLNHI